MKQIFVLFACIVLAATQYNPVLSRDLCQLTVAAYCVPISVLNWNCGPCKNSPLKIKNVTLFLNASKDTAGYIAVSDSLQAILLVFRGTEPWSLKNWISDLKFTTQPYPLCDSGKCKVQGDFYSTYQSIDQNIQDKVKIYKSFFGINRIIVIGHSLGGALATHAVAHLIKAGHPVSLFETYGSPRVGNSDFQNWFQRIYPDSLKARVTHGKDPVVHLPPKTLGFEHLLTEVFYKGSVDDGYKICSGNQDNSCSDQYNLDLSVDDHLTYYGIPFTSTITACQ